MAKVEDDVRARVDAFVAELTTLVRNAALEAVQAQIGGAPRSPGGKAPPVQRKASPATPPARGRPPAKPAVRARRPGEKRDPGELAKIVERLADYIKAHPGQRMEQIQVALGVAHKDVVLPIRKLLSAKRITTKGEKRATTYAPK